MPQPTPQAIQGYLDQYGSAQADLAWELCDRHPGDAVALTCVDERLVATDHTYGELGERSQRLAAGLASLDIGPGDRVATLMGKTVDLVAVILAIHRLRATHVPLFTAFGAESVAGRLQSSGAVLVVCDQDERHKLASDRDRSYQIVTTGPGRPLAGDHSLDSLLEDGSSDPPSPGDVSAPMVVMYTSGTTGTPKGVAMPPVYLAAWRTYFDLALGVTDDDTFWCHADPGWTLGLYCGILTPLAAGRRTVLLAGGFSAQRTWAVLRDQSITDLLTAPTVYRSLRVAYPEALERLSLRRASSAGEPLTPDVNDWAKRVLGVTVHDHYGQTELGMIVNNHHHPTMGRPTKAGSMGQAMPGWNVQVLRSDADLIAPQGHVGRLCVRVEDSPLMWFRGYEQGERTAEKFTPDGTWYITGDLASHDDEDYFSFSSRDDDVIIMAGYRIGPAEIESVLMSHGAVEECAVIAAPDEIRGEVLEAFVVLHPSAEGSDEMAAELQQLVKQRYAAHAYPRRVHFRNELPRTPSGKLQRAALRQRLSETRTG